MGYSARKPCHVFTFFLSTQWKDLILWRGKPFVLSVDKTRCVDRKMAKWWKKRVDSHYRSEEKWFKQLGDLDVFLRSYPLILRFATTHICFHSHSTVFAGTGISMPAGVPSGHEVLSKIRELTGVQSNSLDDAVNQLRNEPDNLRRFIQWFNLRNWNAAPTYAHKRIIKEMNDGHIVALITTNWDSLFEKAYASYRMDWHFPPEKKLVICSSDEDLEHLRQLDPEDIIVVYKIHGNALYYECPMCLGPEKFRIFDPTISSTGTLKCSFHDVDLKPPRIVMPSERIDRSQSEVWDEVTKLTQDSPIVFVIGYSGSDNYILHDYVHRFQEKIFLIKPRKGDPIDDLISAEEPTRKLGYDADGFFRLIDEIFKTGWP